MQRQEINEVMDQYLLIGVGVALSVLGFFLKRIKEEVDVVKQKQNRIEINLARNHEKLINLEKVTEDRRQDIQKLYTISQQQDPKHGRL